MRVVSDQWSVVRCRRAFTLVEVVMVLLVLGIAAAMVVPAVGSDLYASRLKTAANVLASDIEFCQSACIAQPNAPDALVIDVASNTYKVVVFSSSATINYPADSMPYLNDFATGRNAQLSGVTITAISSGTPCTLTFDAYGRPLISADLTITLSYRGQTMTVKVKNGTGDTSIQ